MIHTRSYWLTATPEEQQRIDQELANLFQTHPDLAGKQTVELPYRTIVLKASRRT